MFIILACPFKCEAENTCINEEYVCDGYTNCYFSNQDEIDCGKNKIIYYFELLQLKVFAK